MAGEVDEEEAVVGLEGFYLRGEEGAVLGCAVDECEPEGRVGPAVVMVSKWGGLGMGRRCQLVRSKFVVHRDALPCRGHARHTQIRCQTAPLRRERRASPSLMSRDRNQGGPPPV